MELMVRNAITFNGADSEVGVIAVAFRNKVKELSVAAKTGTAKKRKETEKGAPQPAKKAKHG